MPRARFSRVIGIRYWYSLLGSGRVGHINSQHASDEQSQPGHCRDIKDHMATAPTDRGRTLSNPGLDTVSRSPVTQHPTVHRLVSEAVVVVGRGAKSLGAFKTVSGPREVTDGLLFY